MTDKRGKQEQRTHPHTCLTASGVMATVKLYLDGLMVLIYPEERRGTETKKAEGTNRVKTHRDRRS